jgi:hypothetical protein
MFLSARLSSCTRCAFVLAACSVAWAVFLFCAPPASASDCSKISVGRVPLNDLGAGYYKGKQGGLYPGGSNVRPFAHDSAGVEIANSLVPLDTLGQRDPNGKIVFISIGMSNTTMEFSAFVDTANADPAKNPHLLLVDCAVGGWDACTIADPHADYWNIVASRIRAAGATPAQVQVVWLKNTCRADSFRSLPDSFPSGADLMRERLASIVRIVKDSYRNTRLLFASSRIYAGYATSNLNPEPWAYENGFAVKWLIQEQINGVDSLNFDPQRGPMRAPWIAWGPYMWADGLVPRSDGLVWNCDELQSDGTHPSPLGRAKVASMLKTFCHTDPAAVPWYLGIPTTVPQRNAARGTLRLAVYPTPFASGTKIELEGELSGGAFVTVVNAAGRTVKRMTLPAGAIGQRAHTRVLTWDGRDATGRSVPPGRYVVRVTTPHGSAERDVTLVR